MKPFVLGAIFARGGSKGVPRKNIKLLNGQPLIAYAIEQARRVKGLNRLIVSTDDAQIARVAKQFGAEVPFRRPAELATDRAPELLAWQHAIRSVEAQLGRRVDVIVTIPTTSPLRKPEDIQRCLDKLLATDADAVITVTPAQRSPYFNMVTVDKAANAAVVISQKKFFQRQAAPKVYDVTTVAYAARRDYVMTTTSILSGRVKAVEVPVERALDIDTLFDFKLAEFLMKRGTT